MTLETRPRLTHRQFASHSFYQSLGMKFLVTHRSVEPVDPVVVGDKTLVQAPLILQHISLRLSAEHPANWDTDCVHAVSDGVGVLRVTPLDCVGESSASKCQVAASAQNRMDPWRKQCLCHRRV